MKTRKNIYFKVVALAAIAIAFAMPAKAQLSDNGYANIDWQFNAPLSNNFADKAKLLPFYRALSSPHLQSPDRFRRL